MQLRPEPSHYEEQAFFWFRNLSLVLARGRVSSSLVTLGCAHDASQPAACPWHQNSVDPMAEEQRWSSPFISWSILVASASTREASSVLTSRREASTRTPISAHWPPQSSPTSPSLAASSCNHRIHVRRIPPTLSFPRAMLNETL